MSLNKENKIIATQAERLILEKLENLERKINEIAEKQVYESIEEISLHRLSRLLHKSTDFIKNEIRAGRLRAIIYRGKNREKRYKFRISDVIEYQNKRSTRTKEDLEGIETAEEIARRIFSFPKNKGVL